LASFFNYVFYQKLNVLGDIESYHLFVVFMSSIAVLVVSLFAYEVLGPLGAVVAGMSLGLYPLFFAEGHFNIKDPVEMAFYTLTIWAFWKSLQKDSWKWLLLSLISCGLALGTKFNIVFLPFIVLPYLIIRYGKNILRVRSWFVKIPFSYKRSLQELRSYRICFVLSPVVVLGVFIYLWPYLWQNPVKNFIDAVKYYQDIGTGINYETKYLFLKGFNLYPVYWIIVTTPPFVLLLILAGTVSVFVRRLSKSKTEILWLIWLIVPILRVSLRGMSIYGGVRQIMEYIPAMALISGLGAKSIYYWLTKHFKINKFVLTAFFLIGFVPQFWLMWKIHPNQNVYFNFLVGGLKGAKQKNIPSAGNSFGNAYWQAIRWINQNAEPNSKLALIQGTGQNIPAIQLRNDILFSNNNWSGIDRKGEYLLELNIEPSSRVYLYQWDYAERLLQPVYEVKVDDIVLATVWKNDLDNTKPEFRKNEILIYPKKVQVKENIIEVRLDDSKILTRIYLIFNSKQCSIFNARVETSFDGLNWKSEKDAIPADQVYVADRGKNMVPFFFPGREAKILRLVKSDGNLCKETPEVKIWVLE